MKPFKIIWAAKIKYIPHEIRSPSFPITTCQVFHKQTASNTLQAPAIKTSSKFIKTTTTYMYISPWGRDMVRTPTNPTIAAIRATKISSSRIKRWKDWHLLLDVLQLVIRKEKKLKTIIAIIRPIVIYGYEDRNIGKFWKDIPIVLITQKTKRQQFCSFFPSSSFTVYWFSAFIDYSTSSLCTFASTIWYNYYSISYNHHFFFFPASSTIAWRVFMSFRYLLSFFIKATA